MSNRKRSEIDEDRRTRMQKRIDDLHGTRRGQGRARISPFLVISMMMIFAIMLFVILFAG
ncbi:MAG: hypothetical protein FWB71_04845 [Defluviitaleaceae bacterium]|nr:hypothetical protein [Defluviitaleaceae bacterium]